MPWTEMKDPADAYRVVVLNDKHDVEVGSVIQFYEDGPSYPYVHGNRLGPHSTWPDAVAAVEKAQAQT